MSSTSKSWSERRILLSLLLVLTVLWVLIVFILTKNSSRLTFRRSSHRKMRERLQRERALSQARTQAQALTQATEAFSYLMANRSNLVHDLCNSEHSVRQDLTPADHFVLDRNKGMLYCAVPATRNVMPLSLLFSSELRQYRPKLDSDYNEEVPDFFLSAQQDDLEDLENYPFRLLVVRNPADRLVSFYRDHLEDTSTSQLYRTLGRRIVARYRDVSHVLRPDEIPDAIRRVEDDVKRERILGNPYANPPGPTFTEFVQYVLTHQSEVKYWSAYHDYCFPCGVLYNFIIRFESIEEEGRILRFLLSSENEELITFSDQVDVPSSLDELCSYFSQLDANLFNELILMLTPDFRLFNYSIDEVLSCADEYVMQ